MFVPINKFGLWQTITQEVREHGGLFRWRPFDHVSSVTVLFSKGLKRDTSCWSGRSTPVCKILMPDGRDFELG